MFFSSADLFFCHAPLLRRPSTPTQLEHRPAEPLTQDAPPSCRPARSPLPRPAPVPFAPQSRAQLGRTAISSPHRSRLSRRRHPLLQSTRPRRLLRRRPPATQRTTATPHQGLQLPRRIHLPLRSSHHQIQRALSLAASSPFLAMLHDLCTRFLYPLQELPLDISSVPAHLLRCDFFVRTSFPLEPGIDDCVGQTKVMSDTASTVKGGRRRGQA